MADRDEEVAMGIAYAEGYHDNDTLVERIATALRAAREEGRPKWQTIDTAPRDGTEFQAWIVIDDGDIGWEPKCRFNPDGGAFNFWGRIDYDEEGWIFSPYIIASHWMPPPTPPGDDK